MDSQTINFWTRADVAELDLDPEERRPGELRGQIMIGPDFDAEDEETILALESSRLFPKE